ncbi:MAG: hypothetical protein VCE75_07710, partial [Alphaproteobacteria bacterium]
GYFFVDQPVQIPAGLLQIDDAALLLASRGPSRSMKPLGVSTTARGRSVFRTPLAPDVALV